MKKNNFKSYFKKKSKQTCLNCRFNYEDDHTKINDCNVGSYYAEKGLNKICYEGELWESKLLLRKNMKPTSINIELPHELVPCIGYDEFDSSFHVVRIPNSNNKIQWASSITMKPISINIIKWNYEK